MMSESERFPVEWVEVMEPYTGKHMYANLTTGDCCWNPPPGAKIRKSSDESDQWWELFDQKTQRFYYYNIRSQKTVWHRPPTADIIPMGNIKMTQKTALSEKLEPLPEKEIEKPSPEPMKRGHRRTASARISRESSANHQQPLQRSHLNQSQRVPKLERLADTDVLTDTLSRKSSLHNCKRIPEVDYLEQGSGNHNLSGTEDSAHHHHWLGRSDAAFDGAIGDDLSRLHLNDCPDVIPHSKLHLMQKNNKAVSGVQDCTQNWSNINSAHQPSEQSGSPHLVLDHPWSPTFMPVQYAFQKTRTGNSSIDSGIAADVPTTLWAESPSDDPRFSIGSQHQSALEVVNRQLSITEDDANLTSAAVAQMTPRSQRKVPRTNPKFFSGQATSSFRATDVMAHRNFMLYENHPMPHDVVCQGGRNYSTFANKEHLPLNDHQPERGRIASRLPLKSEGDDSNLFMSRATKDVHQDSVSKVNKSSSFVLRQSADPATSKTSFSFVRFPLQADDAMPSNILSYKPCEAVVNKALQSHELRSLGSSADSDHVRNANHSAAMIYHDHNDHVLKQTNNESAECLRVRHNSEPDYANLQDKMAQLESRKDQDDKQWQTNDNQENQNGTTLHAQARAEPIYANEPLTGRGGLTHDDRFHIPLSKGRFDNSLSSSSSSTVSTPSPKISTRPAQLSSDTRHMSLRRKKWPEKPVLEASHSFKDKSRSAHLHSHLETSQQQRPLSMSTPFGPETDVIVNQVTDAMMQQLDLERFLTENLNEHRKGILGRTVPLSNMLVWTKDPLQKPMIRTDNKLVKKEAPEVFKLIQTYMGDRKSRESSASVAMELINKGLLVVELRDEIYIQLCRQTTRNSRVESLLNGWELLGTCLSFLPPSLKFQSYLESHIYRTLESRDHTESFKLHNYAHSCLRRMEKICQSGAVRKPTMEEIERCRKALLEPSMFGNTLDGVMELQKDKYPRFKLPWIQTTLSEALLNFKNRRLPEGIFRIPGDTDDVNALKASCDQWEAPASNVDPHVLASVLKLWYRELYEPLIPDEFYEDCIENHDNPSGAVAVVSSLPPNNLLVLTYLIRFLQKFASPEYATVTKMDASNLAMVMAPNCLRCHSGNPQRMFENARKEMSFIRTLIQHLDPGYVDGLK